MSLRAEPREAWQSTIYILLYPLVQIGPARIESVYESDFFGSRTRLDLLFASDSVMRIAQDSKPI